MKWKPKLMTPELTYVPPIVVDEPQAKSLLECVGCGKIASMIYEGSSYCRECLKHKLRTGKTGVFYE